MQRPTPRRFWISAASDTGMVRNRNEDGMWVVDRFIRSGADARTVEVPEDDNFFVAVADGVGGSAAGHIASQFVLERFAAALADSSPHGNDATQWLSDIAGEVNNALIRWGVRNPSHHGMATTLTGICEIEGRWYWLNAGDSRLYWVRDGSFTQVSRDHTLREAMQDPSIPGNIITNCFGGSEDFYLDVGRWDIAGVEALLLCSDGLSDYADAATVETLVSQAAGAATEEAFAAGAGKLLEAAMAGGGGDNASLILMRPAAT